MSVVGDARVEFHRAMCQRLFGRTSPKASYSSADVGSKTSTAFAEAMADELIAAGFTPTTKPINKPQTAGTEFTEITTAFLKRCFTNGFEKLRPAAWDFKAEAELSEYFQYEHIGPLRKLQKQFEEQDPPDYWMASVVGGDYHVNHDLVMFRKPESITTLNSLAGQMLLDPNDSNEGSATNTPLLLRNQAKSIVHAAVSTKWTLRSDRAQNVRTEALNLQKHRKGRTPHLVAVTAEPLPSRLESLAVGTGEIDCVYHVALPEFVAGAQKAAAAAAAAGLHALTVRSRKEQLITLLKMVKSRQLRDIADLPFDLAL